MKIGETTRVPTSRCLHCGRVNDAATPVDDNATPEPGNITVCFVCGHIMAFDTEMKLRELTISEILEVAGDERILAVQRARKRMAE